MSFTSQFFSSSITQFIMLAAGLFNSIILVRYLGAEGNGIYALAVLASTAVTVFLGGSGSLQGANPYWVKKMRSEANIIFSNSLFFAFVVLAVLLFLFKLAGGLLPADFLSASIVFLVILAVPVLLFQQYSQGVLWGLDEINKHNVVLIFRSVLLVIANLILVIWLKSGVEKTVSGWLIVSIAAACLSFYFVRASLGNISLKTNMRIFIRSFATTVKGISVDAISFIGTRLDVFLIMYYLGPVNVTYYSIAILVADVNNLIPGSVGRLIFNRAVNNGSMPLAQLSKAGRLCMAYSIGTCLFLLLFSKYPITIFYGKDFSKTFYCLIFLLPGMISQNMNVTINNFLNAREGYPLFYVFATYATVIINIILNILLIPRVGIIGAAVSFSVSNVLRTCLLSKYLFSRVDISFKNFMVPRISDMSLLRYWKVKKEGYC